MRIFLDTANIEQIKEGVKLGVVSGVTTNPTLISKEGHRDYEAVVKEICSIVNGPVSAEVVVNDKEAMLIQARKIAAWAPNVVVKIPSTTYGLEVTSQLSKENIKVNLTLCFSVNQAILGALAGATFISPFVGRLDDAGHDGMALVKDVVDIYKKYEDLTTEVLAASIRHPLHCVAAAKAGAHIATIPYKVLLQMTQNPLTDVGIERFLADWQSVSEGT
ncbi:MAG: fructose-6-phosphate aldolase [Dehalococcoidia bacterium]|nr:MAG: fructose-6-phosphate aldolase [Dehalococcoidia bacterium]